MKTLLTVVGTWALLIGVSAPAGAQLPDNYLTRWNDPAVQRRIEDGIERNRKSDVVLTLVDLDGLPVAAADVTITQKSHEFLFGCNIFVLGQMKEKNKAYEDAFLKLFTQTENAITYRVRRVA